jgi:hypothetical protein
MRERTCLGVATCSSLLLACTIAASSTAAFAQSGAEQTHNKGSQKIAFGANYSSTTSYDRETKEWSGDYFYQLGVQFSYGYFVGDGWELGVAANGTNSWTNRSDTSWGTLAVLADIRYYFVGESDWIPYVGGAIGFQRAGSGDQWTTGATGGGILGVEYLFADNASLFMEYDPSVSSRSDSSSNTFEHRLLFGLNFYW